jgi:integrase
MKKRTIKDGVYTRKDRDGYWITWQDAQGRRRYRRTNAVTLVQARKLRAAELLKVERHRMFGFTEPGKESFTALAKRYLRHQEARLDPKSYQRTEAIVRLHLEPFFNFPVSGIRRIDVQRYVTHRSGNVSPYSVQKETNVLKHMLSLAVEWEIIPFNPAQGVKTPRVPAGRVRYLQPTELRAVLDAAPAWLQPIIALAVTTGMRRSEIFKLRWLDCDLDRRRLMLPQTKNGDGRFVYLNQSALFVMRSFEERRGRPTDHVLDGCTGGQASVAFRRVLKRVGIEDFRWHDLRHTAASWLRMSGADTHTVGELLGQKDPRMAARYQHLSPAFLSAAVDLLDPVFDLPRYRDVTEEKRLLEAELVSS